MRRRRRRRGSRVGSPKMLEEVNGLWQELCGKMEEEVLEKCNVEQAKKGAYKGRGELLEWRIVKKRKDITARNGAKIVGQEFSHGSESTACIEVKACKEVKEKKKEANSNKEWTS